MRAHPDATTAGGNADRLGPAAHTLLRIGMGLLIMQHGVQKLFGGLGGYGGTSGAAAELVSPMGLAGVLEFFGGLLIVLGVFTRPVALVLLLMMLAAYAMAHMPRGPWPILNGGEPALLFALGFAVLAANGGGPLSVDRWRRTRRPESRSRETRWRRASAA